MRKMDIPRELNWVKERYACTVEIVFNQLCDGIREDVELINSSPNAKDPYHFQANMHSSGTTIIVGRPNAIPRRRLRVGVVENRIVVEQEWDNMTWNAVIGLNDEGRCVLRLEDGTQLEQWQFRRRALESLFFE